MQIKDVMTKHMDYLSPEATLQEASQKMLDHDFGFLPIEKNGNLVGVVTDRDIAIRAVAKGLDHQASLNQVMTKNVVTAHENDDVTTAAKKMEEKQIRRLVVLNQNGSITGVVSLGDIATKCNDIDLSAAIIRAVSEKST